MKDRDRIVVSREIPDYAQLVRASELGDLIDDLPPLPQNLIQAIDLLDQPDPDAARLAGLLGRDPALTARLLRTANSPVYYRGTAVTTPAQAIAVMGLARLKSVLVVACIDTLRQAAVAAQPEAGTLREAVWQNSVCTAVAARQIAAELALPDAEESYVHGLLHDLGKLALLHVLPARYVEAYGGSTTGNRGHTATGSGAGTRFGGRPLRLGATQCGSGTGRLNNSCIVQRWPVRPAAIAGVRVVHLGRPPGPASTRRLSCSQQKLYAHPTRYIQPVNTSSPRAIARPRRTNGHIDARNVALSRSMYDVLIPVPVPVADSTPAIASAVPTTTRRVTATRRRPL
jgi:hypothetical protein